MTLTKDEYDSEVKNQAAYLVEATHEGGEREFADYEAVVDVLDGHDWFAGHSVTSTALHGSIIEHGEADVHMTRDVSTLTQADEPAKIVENLAYAQFEADVVEKARSAMEGIDQ